MTSKKTAVFGIYQNAAQADYTVDQLLAAHFHNDDISVLLPDNDSTKDFAHEKNTKAPEGATTGVAAGGAIGGTLGLLAGLGMGGAVGGLIGALVGMGIPEYEAKRFEGRIKAGGVLLSVHCDTSAEIASAKDVLKHTGA